MDDITHRSEESQPKILYTDSIANYLTRIGTNDDPVMNARPELGTRLTQGELEALYLTNDLAIRIIEELVDDALRGGFTVMSEDGNTPIVAPRKHKFLERLERVAKDGRAYGEAALILIPASGADLWVPAEPGEEIASLIEVDRFELEPRTWNEDMLSEHFNEPELYQISPRTRGVAKGLGSPLVHRSRVILLPGQRLGRRLREETNEGHHDSVLQAVWGALSRFIQTEQGIATTVARFEQSTMSIAGLAAVLSSPAGGEMVAKRLDLINRSLSALNAALIDADAGEKYERKFATVTGLDTLWDRLAHSVAKAARMPMTQLFGMSPSGLSTDDESGRANWRKQVASYRDKILGPAIEMYYEHLNGGAPVEIRWSAIEETTPSQEAEIASKRANARQIYAAHGLLEDPRWVGALQFEGILPDEWEPDTEMYEAQRERSLAPPIIQEPADPLEEPVGSEPDGDDE